MRRAILVAVVLSFFVLDEGAAQFKNGNTLFVDCEGGDDPETKMVPGALAQWGMCFGYIMGVADAREFCIPTELKAGLVKAEQVKDGVKLYLRDHPEKRHLIWSPLRSRKSSPATR